MFHVFSQKRRLSLRNRLNLGLGVLLVVFASGSVILSAVQQDAAVLATKSLIESQGLTLDAIRLRELFSELVHHSHSQARAEARAQAQASAEMIEQFDVLWGRVSNRVDRFVLGEHLSASRDCVIRLRRGERLRPTEIQAAIQGLITVVDFQHSAAIALLERNYHAESTYFWKTLFFLFVLSSACALVSTRLIEHLTSGLDRITSYLDRIQDEKDIFGELLPPQKGIFSESPDMEKLRLSLNRLLLRLRRYQSHNFNRVLYERQRNEIFESAISDGIFMFDEDDLVHANPIGLSLLGITSWPPGQRMALGDLMNHPVAKLLAEVRSSAMPISFSREEEFRTAHYYFRATPVLGSIMSWVVVASDVTLVSEVSAAKRQFLANLSHEVRTPVTSLSLATRLLQRDPKLLQEEQGQRLVATCANEVDRLRILLEEFFSATREKALELELRLKTVRIRDLVVSSIANTREKALSKRVTLVDRMGGRILSEPRAEILRCDPTKVVFALSSVLENSIAFSCFGENIEIHFDVNESSKSIEVKIQSRLAKGIQAGSMGVFGVTLNAGGLSRVNDLSNAEQVISAHEGRMWIKNGVGDLREIGVSLPVCGPRWARNSSSVSVVHSKGDGCGANFSSG